MNIMQDIEPTDGEEKDGESRIARLLRGVFIRPFFWLVAVPTFVAAIYLLFIAAPQYQTEAQIIIRSQEEDGPKVGGFGQLIGAGAGLSTGQREAQGLIRYLQSAEAIGELEKAKLDPVTIFQRPEADFLSRLWGDKPDIEDVVEHYQKKVRLTLDTDSNITSITVRTYRPGDSVALAKKVIQLGEQRINSLNSRLVGKGAELASAELEDAKQEFSEAQTAMQNFRNVTKEVNPVNRAQGEQKGLGEKESELDRQQAILNDMLRYLSPNSPQVTAQRSRVAALQSTVGQSRGRLTNSPRAASQNIGNFEELSLRQEMAAKRLESAREASQRANVRAENDRLFVISVVNPFTPEEPVYPRPLRTLLTIFLGLALVYGILWLIIAGIREHRS